MDNIIPMWSGSGLYFVIGSNQLADVFTKALHHSQFRDLISNMRLINIYSLSWLGVLNSEFVRVEFVSDELS